MTKLLNMEIKQIPDRFEFNSLRLFKQNGYYGVTLPIISTIRGKVSDAQAPIFIANRSYQLIEVSARYQTADGATQTLQIERVPTGTAPGSGTDMLTGTINLNSTANTIYYGVIDKTNERINTGDSISPKLSASVTNLANLTISILLKSI